MKPQRIRLWIGTLTLYLPIAMMVLLALGSWWLAQNTPEAVQATPQPVQRQDPDYYLTHFSVKNFDPQGQLVSEILGEKARHFPITDLLEIDGARFRASRGSQVTTGQSDRAYSNADGSELQLVGNARVARESPSDAQGGQLPRLEIRGDFLHAFLRTEEIKSHQPVTILRGADQFSGDRLLFKKKENVFQLDGRVRVLLNPPSNSR